MLEVQARVAVPCDDFCESTAPKGIQRCDRIQCAMKQRLPDLEVVGAELNCTDSPPRQSPCLALSGLFNVGSA